MPQDGSHLRAKLSGITDNDLEWALAGYAELYDTTLGHIGHSWERKEFDLDFKANKPIGDFNHLAFGASVRHMSLEVDEVVTKPWAFSFDPTNPLGPSLQDLKQVQHQAATLDQPCMKFLDEMSNTKDLCKEQRCSNHRYHHTK